MKLWILTPQDNLPSDSNPWDPWFDKTFKFVIRAETEGDARKIADENAWSENQTEVWHDRKVQPWLDPVLSKCVELTSEGNAGVIYQDFKQT